MGGGGGGWQSPRGFAKLSVLSVKLCHLWANLLPFLGLIGFNFNKYLTSVSEKWGHVSRCPLDTTSLFARTVLIKDRTY